MYLQEIETKSKKLGEFHSVKNTVDWFSPFIFIVQSKRIVSGLKPFRVDKRSFVFLKSKHLMNPSLAFFMLKNV